MPSFTKELATKARFARARAARGWSAAYQATPSDPQDQTHTLDPTPDTPGSRFLPCDPIIIKRFQTAIFCLLLRS